MNKAESGIDHNVDAIQYLMEVAKIDFLRYAKKEMHTIKMSPPHYRPCKQKKHSYSPELSGNCSITFSHM